MKTQKNYRGLSKLRKTQEIQADLGTNEGNFTKDRHTFLRVVIRAMYCNGPILDDKFII